MASFQNMVITTAGLELLQDLILEGGTPLTFSGVGVGDGLLEDSDITARTSLVHEVHRLPIEKIEKQEGGHIRVFARLATDIITTDVYHRELGVFARYGEQEILFAYGNAGDDYDFIPATGNNASICKTIVTEFTVGSMKAVFLPLDSKDFVTHEAMNAQVEEVITRETRKVLEAIPQVDASGNMTLPGNITAAGGTFDGTVNANGGINSPSPVATMQSMTTLGSGYAAEAFDLSGYVDLRSIPFSNAVNVSKVSYPYLMDKDLVVFREVFADNNFLSYPVIKFDRYNFAWGTFPPSSMVLSMGGTYMNFEAGEHNAIMGFALGQTSLAAQSVSEVASPYIYLNMYSRARAQMTLSIYYNTGDGEQVIVKPGRTQSINRLYLIYEQVNNSTARISAGVVYSYSNLGVTSREVTIYRMGEIAVDYYACAEKVIPFFSNNTTQPTISTMNRILGLGVYPGMLITDYFSKVI